MVNQVANMSKNGVSDWVIQRVSALVLAAYTLCIFGYVVMNPGMDYVSWSGFMGTTAMQVFTLLALLSTAAHAWIGMWTVGSDYLQEHTLGSNATFLRSAYQVGSILIIVTYLIWGINILWGN
mgnify:FL=1